MQLVTTAHSSIQISTGQQRAHIHSRCLPLHPYDTRAQSSLPSLPPPIHTTPHPRQPQALGWQSCTPIHPSKASCISTKNTFSKFPPHVPAAGLVDGCGHSPAPLCQLLQCDQQVQRCGAVQPAGGLARRTSAEGNLPFFFWKFTGGAHPPPAGHTQTAGQSPTAGGRRQSLTDEGRLTHPISGGAL